jgi:hypothetical protein
MDEPKQKQRPGPKPERVRVEGDPIQQFRKLLRPTPKPEPRKRSNGKAASPGH